MAAPVTHIVLTEKIFNKYFKNKNKKDFFVGTSFPDVRYLRVIEREKTHFLNIKINELINQDSFTAGLKFHSLIDEICVKLMESEEIYSLCPGSKYPSHFFIYLLMDELLYDKINRWDNFIDFFNKVVSGEKSFGISIEIIERWHRILQNYFSQKPNDNSREKLITSIDFSEDDANNINNLISEIKSNRKINNVVKKLYLNFDSFI